MNTHHVLGTNTGHTMNRMQTHGPYCQSAYCMKGETGKTNKHRNPYKW